MLTTLFNQAGSVVPPVVLFQAPPFGAGRLREDYLASEMERLARKQKKKALLNKERKQVAELLGVKLSELKYEEFLENESIEALLLS